MAGKGIFYWLKLYKMIKATFFYFCIVLCFVILLSASGSVVKFLRYVLSLLLTTVSIEDINAIVNVIRDSLESFYVIKLYTAAAGNLR